MTIRLSGPARRDLDGIRSYTVETWGREQWLKYYRGMVDAFEEIAADPDGGRDRSLFAAGLRSVNYGRHVIFFARLAGTGDEPVIIRIVLQRRKFPALVYYEDIGSWRPWPMSLGCRNEMPACYGRPNPTTRPDCKAPCSFHGFRRCGMSPNYI
ncbi:MAG: type II toxin-antitoxin system RelE/ParE family toxin [Gammaproteobacteria bacterium]|nr:type II toxin-antitoxin system RelE/ParE family toxin [Gammaproteobacteria bacterium]MYG67134.1 type II toxin-antitoxin system RelE/ParE family toxin [Gammaproteobacteria bacterium]